MDKAKFEKEMHEAKERLHLINDASAGNLSVKEHIHEYLISYAILNASDEDFKKALENGKEKHREELNGPK
tara:strand:- start:121 stop:333 length:213 start_codon:yes stop_codon:yes gene_type:complete